jgi:secreted trypsin-like serine protease
MKKFLVLMVVLIILLGTVGIAQAITNGQPDGDGHPYVGLVTDFQFVCSGAAISRRVVVTAAHCFDEPGQKVSVTFDPDGIFASGPRVFHSGTWYPDPDFCQGCGGGLPGFDTHDVAVVVLDRPVKLPVYASLPAEGLVDTLAMGTEVTTVGYGVQSFARGGGPPSPDAAFTRFFAPTNLIQSDYVISAEFIKLSANPAQGKGSVCFGDSGGPDLLGDTDTILAVNSFGADNLCHSVVYSYRIDTSEALNFIQQFDD